MELQLEQQQLSAFALQARRTAEERFSADCVVPDSLPDAASLLLTEGDLCLWRLDLNEGSAELEGEISARVCYLAESGEASGFPVSAPVTLRFRGENLQSGMRPQLRCRVSELTGQLLNSRKIRVQGRLSCELSCYTPHDYNLTTGIDSEEKGLYLRRSHTQFSVVSAVEEQVFTVSDSPALRLGFPTDGHLLSYHSDPVLDETQILDGRLILQGRVITTLLYRDEKRGEVLSESVETPFSQMMDVDSEYTVSAADTALYLTSEEVRCRNDDPVIETEFHLLAQVVCHSHVETECVTDAYSTRGDLTLSRESDPLSALPSETSQEYIEGVLSCDPTGKSVCAARAALRGNRAEVTLLVTDADGGLFALSDQLCRKQCRATVFLRFLLFRPDPMDLRFASRHCIEKRKRRSRRSAKSHLPYWSSWKGRTFARV